MSPSIPSTRLITLSCGVLALSARTTSPAQPPAVGVWLLESALHAVQVSSRAGWPESTKYWRTHFNLPTPHRHLLHQDNIAAFVERGHHARAVGLRGSKSSAQALWKRRGNAAIAARVLQNKHRHVHSQPSGSRTIENSQINSWMMCVRPTAFTNAASSLPKKRLAPGNRPSSRSGAMSVCESRLHAALTSLARRGRLQCSIHRLRVLGRPADRSRRPADHHAQFC